MPCVQRQKPSQELVCPPPSVHPLGRLVALMPIIQDFGHVPSGGMPLSPSSWEEVRPVSFYSVGSSSRKPPILTRVLFPDASRSRHLTLPVEAEAQRGLECSLGHLGRAM